MSKLRLDWILRDIVSSGKATFFVVKNLERFDEGHYQPNAGSMVKAFGKARCCQDLRKSKRFGFDVWLEGEDLAEVKGPERYLEVPAGCLVSALAPRKLGEVGDSDNLPPATLYFQHTPREGKPGLNEVYLHMRYIPPLTDVEAEEWRREHPYPRGI